MAKVHLLVTSAFIPEDKLIIGEHNGASDFHVRRMDYENCFYQISKITHFYDTVTVLECYSKRKDNIKTLKESGLDVMYSKHDNSRASLCMNELTHMKGFVDQKKIADDDIIVKLSGRYNIYDPQILLDLFNVKEGIEVVAKDSDDIYAKASSLGPSLGNRGVHTFYWGFRKKWFNMLFGYAEGLNPRGSGEKIQEEHLVKGFMWVDPSKSLVLHKDEKIGAVSNVFSNVPYKGDGAPNFLKICV